MNSENLSWLQLTRTYPCPGCHGIRKPCETCHGRRVDPAFDPHPTVCICPERNAGMHTWGCPQHDPKTCSVCDHLGTDPVPVEPVTSENTAPPGFCPLCLTDLRGDDADVIWIASAGNEEITISDKHVKESYEAAGWVIKSYGRIWAEEDR